MSDLFGDVLGDADRANKKRRLDRETAHLPDTMKKGIPYHIQQINDYHAAMLRADYTAANEINAQAHLLAVRINKGEPGILANDDSPGHLLKLACAARMDAVPLWGQHGSFVVTAAGCRVRVETDGMFGIGMSTFPGFSAHVVDRDHPFISETGYRSFLGNHMEREPGVTIDRFVVRMIQHVVRRDMKGKLVMLKPEYRTSR